MLGGSRIFFTSFNLCCRSNSQVDPRYFSLPLDVGDILKGVDIYKCVQFGAA